MAVKLVYVYIKYPLHVLFYHIGITSHLIAVEYQRPHLAHGELVICGAKMCCRRENRNVQHIDLLSCFSCI